MGGYCELHQKIKTSRYDKQRGSSAKRGYGSKWRVERDKYLRENPYCVECLKKSKYVMAKVVDHKIPHRGDMKLFWDKSNWQSLCTYHHNRKTALGG